MTKIQLTGKIALTILGIYFITLILDYLEPWLVTLTHDLGNRTSSAIILKLMISCLVYGIAFVLIYKVFFSSDKLLLKISGALDANTNKVAFLYVLGGFRIACFFCGVMILERSIETLVNTAFLVVHIPEFIRQLVNYQSIPNIYRMSAGAWLGLLIRLLKSALALYLILGAPHFVRYQIKKCNMLPEEALNAWDK